LRPSMFVPDRARAPYSEPPSQPSAPVSLMPFAPSLQGQLPTVPAMITYDQFVPPTFYQPAPAPLPQPFLESQPQQPQPQVQELSPSDAMLRPAPSAEKPKPEPKRENCCKWLMKVCACHVIQRQRM
jgi:hypothetical protein